MLDRRGIHAADGQVQIDAAEHLEAGHLFADHVREPRGRVVVILEDYRAHAVGARQDRRLESVAEAGWSAPMGPDEAASTAANTAKTVFTAERRRWASTIVRSPQKRRLRRKRF
ncbi:MAG: hypothetical protein DMF94_04595 [Acidobacteria bacterium]|nr:MAG: hypothetical protein DMF94_04595 [Acidobacteriota bacterium]